MSDDTRLTVLQVQSRDMATGGVVSGATGIGVALLALGAPAAYAVCMPLLAYSALTLARVWHDVRRRRAKVGE